MKPLAYLPAALLVVAALYCVYRGLAASESHSELSPIVVVVFLGIAALLGGGALVAGLIARKLLRK